MNRMSTETELTVNGSGVDGRRGWILLISLLSLVILPLILMFLATSQVGVGLFGIAMMLGLVFLKVPVAAALIVPGLLGTFALRGLPAMKSGLTDVPYDTTASWSLSVIPMFVLMGLLLWQSGITTKAYAAGRDWLSWLPGGLGVGTTLAGAGLAAVSGSSIATTYALARAGIPEMLKAGYDRRVAIMSVAVASLPGQLIPPSILLVIYAGIAEVPVGPQLMAGIVPGVLIAVLATIFILCIVKIWPRLTRVPGQRDVGLAVSWGDRWRSLAGMWPLPFLAIIVIGGIYAGILTVTEAGAAAAFVALLLTFFYKRNEGPGAAVSRALRGTVSSTGAIFFLVIGAMLFSRMLTLSGVTQTIGDWIVGMEMSSLQFLLLLIAIYLIMGMFLDPLAMMLLTVPILIPTLESLDISLVWFGVFVVFMGELAVLTPPVGLLTFVIHNITKSPDVNQGVPISLRDTFVAIAWIFPLAVLFLAMLIAFPEIATFLPARTGGG